MKDIPGYEGIYSITEDGRVWRNKVEFDGTRKTAGWHLTGRWLSPYKKGNGYLQVGLLKNGRRKYYMLHRLVAITYLGEVEGKPTINHIDENKQNNHVSNLEWCDQKHNRREWIKNHPITGENNPNYRHGRSIRV